jgi:hypothetical protein
MRTEPRAVLLLALPALLILAGCTSRGITITSEPPGAEVSINRRVVGKTPIRVGFEHYGAYRLELRLRGYETLVREADIKPTAYGYDPGAFLADNFIPARLDDEIYLHYALKVLPATLSGEKLSLLERAGQARWGNAINPKTGEHLAVALARDPPQIQAADSAAGQGGAPDTAGTVKPEKEEVRVERPEGLVIAKHINALPEEPEENNLFVNSESPKPAQAPAVPRIAKDEELIYDEPAAAKEAGKGVSGKAVSGGTSPVSGDTIPIAAQSGHVPGNSPEAAKNSAKTSLKDAPKSEANKNSQ